MLNFSRNLILSILFIGFMASANSGFTQEIVTVYVSSNGNMTQHLEGTAPLKVRLDASLLKDIEDYTWFVSNDKIVFGKITALLFQKSGIYTIDLEVIDKYGTKQVFPQLAKITVKSRIDVIKPDSTTTQDISSTAISDRIVLPPTIFPKSHTFTNIPILGTNNPQTRARSLRKSTSEKANYWPNRVVVKFRENTQTKKRRSLRSHVNGTLIKNLPLMNAEVWQVKDVEKTIITHQRRAYPDIEYIEPDYIVYPSAVPNDPKFEQQWGLQKINAPAAWDIVTGTENPVVCAVIDSGVDYTHPDLVDNMWTGLEGEYGYDVIDKGQNPMDECGHGTHVAGIIASVGNNGIGITGVNWSAKIMAIRFMGYKKDESDNQVKCLGSSSDVAEAIKYVTRMKDQVKCINTSWTDPGSQVLYEAIQAVNDAGQLIIAAAGNNRADNDIQYSYPASYDFDNIISVCATNWNDKLYSQSNFGKQSVDLCAPGSSILSTALGSEYGNQNGTSIATSYVAGAATLLWSAFPYLTVPEIKTHILESVDEIDDLKETSVTGGRLNVYNAITSTQSQQQTFTVTNHNNINLTIKSVTMTGVGATEFRLVEDTCSSTTLAPNDACTVKVFLSSTSNEAKEVFLEVHSNARQTVRAILKANAVLAVYNMNTNQLEIPRAIISTGANNIREDRVKDSIVVENNVVGETEIYRATLCSLENQTTWRFQLCDAELRGIDISQSGDTVYDISQNRVHIPAVKVEETGKIYEVFLLFDGHAFEVTHVIAIQ